MCDNDCSLTLILRQIYCQNGTRRTQTTAIDSLIVSGVINLNFGYLLIVSSISGPSITLTLRDTNQGFPDQTITLSCNSYKMISLPAQNGTYRVYIILRASSFNQN